MTEWILPTMTCGHCVKAVTAALRNEDPQARVEIDLATHRVQVESSVDQERQRRALVEAGYEPAATA